MTKTLSETRICLDDWRAEGRAILRHKLQQVRAAARNAELVRFAGVTALAVNYYDPNEMSDEVGPRAPSGLTASWERRAGRYKVSLRLYPVPGLESINCADIAAACAKGGGGHRSAAGFECDELPWRGWPLRAWARARRWFRGTAVRERRAR